MRAEVVLAASLVAVLGSASASASTGPTLSVADPANDANGLNDQGENVVRDVATPVGSSPEADLRRLELDPLVVDGRVEGWRLRLQLQGGVGRHGPSGEDLAHTFIAQAGADCRFTVTHRTDGGAVLRSSPGCGGSGDVPLTVAVTGRELLVELPYSRLPPALQAGRRLTDVQANTRVAPPGAPPAGQLDSLYSFDDYRLPS